MKIKVIIADDEPLGRQRLRQFLQQESDLELLEECADGQSAVKAIESLSPDLVFLDVQMPGLDGFKVVEKLEPEKMPVIIFVTAHEEFALKAFEIHALDYLLKPFDQERLQTALDRARRQLAHRQQGNLGEKLAALMGHLPERKAGRMSVKSGGKILLIELDEVDWIGSEDNYVNIHTGPNSILHRETLAEIETRLDPQKFLRISRSAIVNISRVKELEPLFHGEYSVKLKDGTRLTLTRSYRHKVALLGK